MKSPSGKLQLLLRCSGEEEYEISSGTIKAANSELDKLDLFALARCNV